MVPWLHDSVTGVPLNPLAHEKVQELPEVMLEPQVVTTPVLVVKLR